VAQRKDSILVIDPDPTARSLLSEGVLEGSGLFTAMMAADGAEGMSMVDSHAPDLIIMELDMPGLSGKDLMVALNSQGYTTPVIVTTYEGGEALAVEAFRLGAKDFLTKPYREAEVISAVERALNEVHWQRERDQMTENLHIANQALEQRLIEERTLFAIGKSVTSMTDLEKLFNLIVEAAAYLTRAQMSGAFLRDDKSSALILHAGKNLPAHLAQQIGQPITDNLAALIMTSGEPLLASGDGLKRFSPPHDAHSVIYVPLVVAEQAVGILWVGNQNVQAEFVEHQRDLLSALADYAAIAVVNARLFQVMDQRARRLEQANVQLQDQQTEGPDRIALFSDTMRGPLEEVRHDLYLLRTTEHQLHPQNEASLDVLDRKLREILDFLNQAVQRAGRTGRQ
jgi:two-component system NtrC family sensor kinase